MPDNFETLFSILAEQAEQVMPVMSNCSFFKVIPSFFQMILCKYPSPVGNSKLLRKGATGISQGRKRQQPQS